MALNSGRGIDLNYLKMKQIGKGWNMKILVGVLFSLIFGGVTLAADKYSEYELFIKDIPTTIGKVGSLVNRCALNKELALCDAADGLVRVMKGKMESLPAEEKINHAASLSLLQGFIEGYEAKSSLEQESHN